MVDITVFRGAPHLMDVVLDEGALVYEIHHNKDCPTVEIYKDVTDFNCPVASALGTYGTNEWFEPLELEPGRYRLKAFREQWHNVAGEVEFQEGVEPTLIKEKHERRAICAA